MNYSVAGFQVDCLVNNFVKSLLGAIYAVKIISMALIYRMKEVEGILCQNFFLHNVNILLSRAHICHEYHELYLWRKNCHVGKLKKDIGEA